jgi:hypothetical protein
MPLQQVRRLLQSLPIYASVKEFEVSDQRLFDVRLWISNLLRLKTDLAGLRMYNSRVSSQTCSLLSLPSTRALCNHWKMLGFEPHSTLLVSVLKGFRFE